VIDERPEVHLFLLDRRAGPSASGMGSILNARLPTQGRSAGSERRLAGRIG
jgi:hypothetical protein